MAYDVFMVADNADKDMADLVVRRLRALKFKVRYNKRGEEPTFDAKDARDAMNSQSMLVLWSENAVKSDWVRAAASVGHSRPGVLVQTALDKTIPYEPFKVDKRFKLEGMTSRKSPEDWYKTVEELGRRDGRKDLREWMDYKTKDEDSKSKWLADHPTDPLALHAKKLRDKKLGIKPAPAAAAVGAAALAAASISGASAAKPSAAAKVAAPAPAAAAAAASYDDEDLGIGWGTIAAILAAIGLMLLLGYFLRSKPLPKVPGAGPAYATAAGPASVMAVCPAGTAPANIIKSMTPTEE